MLESLKALINIKSPSGNESPMRQIIIKKIKPFVDKVYIDKYGNVIAQKVGTGQKIMLTAHMDEVGLMVKSIDQQGLMYCSEIGGIDPVTMLGERVMIESKKKPMYGLITTKEISNGQPKEKLPTMSDLVIDTGLTKKELVKKGVEIGAYIYFTLEAGHLGSEEVISGKALDDITGCYILLEIARQLKNMKRNIYFVFTVQEEIGLYGAQTSIHGIDPDWAINVDVTGAEDFGENPRNCIGKGPCLTIKDADTITNRCLNDKIKDVAKKLHLPLQLEVNEVGSTDALNISIAKGGIPTAVLGVAVRNIHTTSSVAHAKDIENTIKILVHLLKKPTKDLCLPQ